MQTSLPPLDVPNLLRQFGLHPKKSLGQNFLVDPTALEKVVNAGGVGRTDTILEIGPGLGSLTRHLASQAARVIAVELDHNLIPILREVLTPFDNIEIIHGDILETNLQSLISNSQYLVIANIPYYITSAVIRHFLESGHPPTRMVLTVQREVAERICANPPDMNLLALSVQVYGQPVIAAHIPARAFYPPPKVASAVVRIDILPEPRLPRSHLDTFFKLIKAGFSQKRKTLRNALSSGLNLPKETVENLLTTAGIDPTSRAETLNLEEWGRLAEETTRRKDQVCVNLKSSSSAKV
ncbi:MAG TPA: 16S rRNA (adenine(1518)-N(6)/adenine(1519)-N(6))-dimethyltransferase RsmA [Anaerolineales bacterium]|nr:16S rRNA (adenine(1518)-N(6)/adenine(1519)-N(6))-dimethyltransferase RsmA [Anaerolineales bacterium]